jgi:adenylylsulfate reductase subunit B
MPPVIVRDQCTGCGTCFDLCAEDVFFGTKEEEPPVVSHPEACFHCYLCVNECPSEAIRLRTPMAMTVPYR